MLKYIIFDKHDIPMVVIFDCLQQHVDIRNKIKLPVLSAGKLNDKFECCAGSVSLDIKPSFEQSQKDAQTIKKMMNYH